MKSITEAEIFEQPKVVRKVARECPKLIADFVEFLRRRDVEVLFFVGCGSSYNLGLALCYQAVKFGLNARAFCSSEVMFGLIPPPRKALLVGISRSGETTETVKALELAKKRYGVRVAAVTCCAGSSITEVADVSVVIPFVRERTLVLTQSATAMGLAMSAAIREVAGRGSEEFVESVAEAFETALFNAAEFVESLNVSNFNHFVFLGYDEYFAVALEGEMKLTEMALADVEAYKTLEYRHGPRNKASEETLVVVMPSKPCFKEEVEMAEEIKRLGAKIAFVSPLAVYGEKFLKVRDIPHNGDWILRLLPIQIMGLRKAEAQGINPDNPRGLSRVVVL